MDRLIKLDEYKAIESLNYIVIVDPTRVDAGFWFSDALRVWRNAAFQDPEAIIEMPLLGLAITLASLYERVAVASHPGLRLVWEDGAGGLADADVTPP